MGAYPWSTVAERFNEVARDKEWPLRNPDGLKTLFNKLRTFKEPTGDPTCPAPVREAKRIARDIEERCVMTTLGLPVSNEDNADQGEHDENNEGDVATETSSAVQARPPKRN